MYNDALVQTFLAKLSPTGKKTVITFIKNMGDKIDSIPGSVPQSIKSGMEVEIINFITSLDKKEE
jgi:hypothetical protein